ncbi:MAG TPA: DUF2333 family protein [Vineibacter sp.]|nr:DUF2333 family protein [Vineibacter sp.]
MTFEPDDAKPRLAQPWWRRALGWRPKISLSGVWTALVPKGRWKRLVLVLVLIPVLYYGGGGLWLHRIDDRPDFEPQNVQPGESRAVAIAAALITREVDDHHWTPMDPFFLPGAWLDNMPNYQAGIMKALARFAVEMRDQLARSRGSSPQDPDLDRAAARLNADPKQWVWTPSMSIWPSVTATSQYRDGRAALITYNKRLAANQASFERRADNLQAFLERVASDIGSTSAQIDRHIHDHGGDLLDFYADNLFYANKGQLYAYYMLLKELGNDYQTVLRERDLTGPWAQLMETFRTAATLQPWVVVNGAADSQFLPSHLVAQGFYLLRARTQLREVADILRK